MSELIGSKGKSQVAQIAVTRKTAQGDTLVWSGSFAEAREIIKFNKKPKQAAPNRWLKMLNGDGVFL